MDQADRLRSLKKAGPGESLPRIISITSGKGGVGKTNIAVNLAGIYARRGSKVLLIDADFGLANSNVLLGVNVDKTIDDVLFNGASLSDIFVKTRYGFDLIPSSSGLRKMLSLDTFSQRVLFDRLFDWMKNYDFVIYDTAPGLGHHVLHFNTHAHDIVIVARPEPTAILDAYALIKVLAQERKEKRFKLIINEARTAELGIESFRKLINVSDEFLNISIDFLGSIPVDGTVEDCVRRQSPIFATFPKSAFSLAVERIGDKLSFMRSYDSRKQIWGPILEERGAQ